MHPLLERQLKEQGVAPAALSGDAAQVLRAAQAALQQAEAELHDKAEAHARHAEKLALVASRTDNAVIITDVEGRIEWVNEGFTRISGYTPQEVMGRKPGSFLQGPETDPLMREFMREQLARGEGFKTEIINYAKDGRKYWLGIEVQPIYDAKGDLRNFMAIESDITERKRVEQELQQAKEIAEHASRAKSEFLANMSHEIRTPLNGVIGMTELLLGSALEPQQRRFVQIAKSSADALLVVINQILDFSKVEAGKLELEKIEFDLRNLLEEVAEMLAYRAASKGIELAGDIHPAVQTALIGDPSRLRQILINLVNNAVKFTSKGQVIIRVTPVRRTDGHAMLHFAVIDSGIGIPEERRDRLFKAFSQVDASTTRKFGGTGLGLVICKQLTELMGGDIGVESQTGQGSTFWFTAAFATRDSISSTQVPRHDLKGVRVLAVDDNDPFRQILCNQLTAWGMRVEAAAGGHDALRMLRQAVEQRDPFRLAVIDAAMPVMNGMELSAKLKAEPSLAGTAVVLLTSLNTPIDAPQARSAGVVDAVTKPLRQSQLFDALMRALAAGSSQTPASFDVVAPKTLTAVVPGACILLAEDNEVNQIVACETLTRAGFKCDVVGDGKAAAEAIAAKRYHAVLMDCQMPEMDGFQATATIRRWENEHGRPRTPIIALTANAIKGDREQCLEAGMDDYLCKPLDPKQLIQTLNRMIQPLPAEPATATPAGSIADQPADDSPFDLGALLDRCMGDQSFRDRLLAKFPEQALATVQKLAECFATGDAKQAARAAHTLKGTAANLSASTLQKLAAELESLGNSGSLDEAQRRLEALRAEVERCVAFVQAAAAPQPVNSSQHSS